MPGVGSFDFVIKNLKKLYGKKFIKISQKKVLAICVGLQILFQSDEGKLPGLNILEDIPQRLDNWIFWTITSCWF